MCSLRSQPPEMISFVHMGADEGLSQNTIFDITQDKQGNMWFATYNGLNKYDGYNFTVYQHDEEDPCSIGNDIIRVCLADHQGRLWIGTEEGLSLYDADKDAFLNFSFDQDGKKQSINGIAELDDHRLLVYSKKEKLLIFDTARQDFSHDLPVAVLASIAPTSIYRQGDHIYIGSFEGVFDYSVSQQKVKRIMQDELKGIEVLAVLQQSPTQLWIASEGNGLYLFNPQTGKAINYTYTPDKKGSISSDYVRSLAVDTQNRLWIGAFNSLNIYNEHEDNFKTYTCDLHQEGKSSQISIRKVFMDSQGGTWLGTYLKGLKYYHPLKNRFHHLQPGSLPYSLNSGIINCIQEDSSHNIWIGTNNGGLNCYNPTTRAITCYTQKNGLDSDDVKAIYIDEDNDLIYIGTHRGGLSILHRNSGRIETINTESSKNIYSIEPGENGKLWMSGMSNIICFNPKNKTVVPVNKLTLSHDRMTHILHDSKRRLWIVSEEGLFSYTEKDDKLHPCQILPPESPVNHKFINCMYEAQNGVFWIGTRSGIYRFDEQEKEIKQYTVSHGLPSNVIHGIQEDSFGKLWISTDKGLSYLQPQTGKFRNFTSEDGLQSNQFATGASCRTSAGMMYFGGINGISIFHPNDLTDNPYIPPVIITQLRLFNKPVIAGDAHGILKKSISETGSITLSSKQSMFSLEFVVSNYIAGNHNTFAYMLEGYDKEWYYTNTQRIVSYSNLPQGTYRFRVKAANNDGKWNETPTELEIIILPVWYKTLWAILLFIAAFIAATTFVFRYFWVRKSMKAQIEMERIDKERLKEVNEMKLRFFINISHELRTPLTLILSPLQELLEKVNDRWMRKQLEHIQKNTNRLLHLVNQLMDYRRAELEVFRLKVKHTDIHQVIERNFLFYERVAQRKGIEYNFHSELEDRKVLCDPNYLELIENNLLSNAFKYTSEGQSITVILKMVENELLLQVKDTGSGIPIDKQGKIFERFYQVENNHIGSGIGLSLVQRLVELHHGKIELDSAEGAGSTFSIYLPTDESSYPSKESGITGTEENEEQYFSTNLKDMYVVDTEKDIEEKEESNETEDDRQKETVMIIEDNIEIRQYLSNELGKSFHIIEAGNGKEALETLKEKEVGLILTDVMMPEMDGLQLCKQVKQNLRTSHIPIIILSAKADLKEQLEGLQVGADDYIPKPFTLALVRTKIRNIFRTRYRAIRHYSHATEIEPDKLALNPLDEELLKKAVEVVEKHLDDVEFSTEDFAREMLMSRSNLHLKMKALTGESTNDFIRKIRFNQACKLLKEGRYNVSEISTMVGFNTPSYFATCFKKHFGCLPSDYVKNRNV